MMGWKKLCLGWQRSVRSFFHWGVRLWLRRKSCSIMFHWIRKFFLGGYCKYEIAEGRWVGSLLWQQDCGQFFSLHFSNIVEHARWGIRTCDYWILVFIRVHDAFLSCKDSLFQNWIFIFWVQRLQNARQIRVHDLQFRKWSCLGPSSLSHISFTHKFITPTSKWKAHQRCVTLIPFNQRYCMCSTYECPQSPLQTRWECWQEQEGSRALATSCIVTRKAWIDTSIHNKQYIPLKTPSLLAVLFWIYRKRSWFAIAFQTSRTLYFMNDEPQ